MESWVHDVNDSVDRHFDEMVTIRRHLHAHPELSGEEHETSLFLYHRLSEPGFEVRIGPEGRGVVVDFASTHGKADSGRLAIRADIDALRIHDQKDVGYRSQRAGIMHACGHDAHAAICLGTLLALQSLDRDDGLPWPILVRGVLQPAEETCQGANEMIQAGVLDDVDAILALHVDPSRDVGHLGFRAGVLTANCDAMRIRITGRGGHAARPHEATDPIAAGAQLINSLYMFVPRRTDSQDAVVLTIGQIRGAETLNAIPEWIELGGTLRTLNREVREATIAHIRQLADGIGQLSVTEIEVDFGIACAAVNNDSNLIQLLRRAAESVIRPNGIEEIPRPSMGSEDFAFYLDHVPGAMFRLGCGSERVERAALHSPSFDIDEEALRVGAAILANSIVRWFEPPAAQTSYQI